ncbi:hypothetical protein LCG56_27345 (plasmid) [Pseudomonas cannabina pv. alisalensis]|uniref:Uncharacterized protein n=1 Tax=Pseudomonas syringae pv. maculicola str. ES4326 TaxID=629265 RepID=A0A8T8C9X5_PSEYM|nr:MULTISPECIES: hypothetical protein [Pseudomonas syringae group]QHF00503.1 hypothetical protein PMA4326_028725 [Pseudomonas syringae pv. maculicola str. ES4326]UBZ00481.1 hypothetical protein LCG56_27345 [Pseudomonas cannabina pv. alisalensis]
MNQKKHRNPQDFIEPKGQLNHSQRWTYTSIAYRSSKQKFRYFYLPLIALLVIIPLLCEWALSEGNTKSDAVGISMALFAFYMWFCFFFWWPMLGADWLSKMEAWFGPKTRASLWKQFRSGEVNVAGMDVPQTSKNVGEYDNSEYKKLFVDRDARLGPL